MASAGLPKHPRDEPGSWWEAFWQPQTILHLCNPLHSIVASRAVLIVFCKVPSSKITLTPLPSPLKPPLPYCLPSCNPTWKQPKPRIDVCPAEVQRKCPNTFLLWACSSGSETSLLMVWETTPGRSGLGWSLEAWVSDTGTSPLLTSWPLVVVCTWFLGIMPTRGVISQSLYLIIWLWLCFSSQILCLLKLLQWPGWSILISSSQGSKVPIQRF